MRTEWMKEHPNSPLPRVVPDDTPDILTIGLGFAPAPGPNDWPVWTTEDQLKLVTKEWNREVKKMSGQICQLEQQKQQFENRNKQLQAELERQAEEIKQKEVEVACLKQQLTIEQNKRIELQHQKDELH